jgi:hydroxymethylglutaryl-CoA synthase
MCADCQFGGKSGTAAMQICLGLIGAGMIRYGLAVGSDSFSRHTAPNTFMEYLASAGAADFILGSQNVIAEIEGTFSYTTDTADFFRVDGDRYLRRGVAEEEEDIGYNSHVINAAQGFFKKFNTKPEDYQYAVFNQNTGKIPMVVGKKIGFPPKVIQPGILADRIGDCGSASPLISLAHVLDTSKPGDRIFVASYGYGASSDILSIRVTDLIEAARQRRKDYPGISAQIDDKIDIDYKTYLRLERKIIQEYI